MYPDPFSLFLSNTHTHTHTHTHTQHQHQTTTKNKKLGKVRLPTSLDLRFLIPFSAGNIYLQRVASAFFYIYSVLPEVILFLTNVNVLYL
jgi:hypothetical protein